MPLVLLNTRIFAGGADLTGQSNRVELTSEVEEKDVTPFRPPDEGGWKEVTGGLFNTSLTGSGQWEAGDPGQVDDAAWAALIGRGITPWTICPESASAGELAWFTSALVRSYTVGGAPGDVAPWEAQAAGASALLRGAVAHPPGTPRTASGSGTGLELGQLASGQRLHAALHVLSAAGTTPSITARIESDDSDTFASPTTRATFSAATARGGQAVTVAGPVTDTWWRVAWTITGTSPSFLFIAALGIA